MLNNTSSINSIHELKRKENNREHLSKTELAEEKIKQQKINFFQLLAVQMQNQDPTNPMDTNQMAEQVFTLNSLEQQLEMVKIQQASLDQHTESKQLLQDILGILKGQQMMQPSTYVGKTVFYEDNKFSLQDENVDISYSLEKNISIGNIEIKNIKGDIVLQLPSEISAGEHIFTWNGKDAQGNKLEKGRYTVTIATSDNDKLIPVKTFIKGKIDSVIHEGDNYIFNIEGKEIERNKIKLSYI